MGNVQISADGGDLGTYPLDSNGQLILSTSAFSSYAGFFGIVATYQGSPQYSSLAVTTALEIFSGKPVITAQTLTCSPTNLYVGNSGSCTLQLTGTGATGNVAFTIDNQPWQTASLNHGVAVASGGFANLPAGKHVVVATYSGDGNFAGFPTSTTEIISASKPLPPNFTLRCIPAPVTQGATGSCTANVSGGATGSVNLYVNGQPLSTNPYSLDATGAATVNGLFGNLPVGASTVAAVYAGDNNYASATAGSTVQVTDGMSTPTISVSCSPSAMIQNQTGSCTAQLAPGATGQVTFLLDNTVLPVANVSSSQATTPISSTNLAVGTHSVTAWYSGDSNFNPESQGANLTITTQPSQVAVVTLACSPSMIVVGQTTNCTAQLSSGATGAVYLQDSSGFLDGEGLNANSVATFSNILNGAAPGTYTIGAIYTGDQNMIRDPNAQQNASVRVQVLSQASSQTVQAALNPSTIPNGGQVQLQATVTPGATGTVTVSYQGTQLAVMNLDSTGTCTALIDFTGPNGGGAYPLTFSYSGDPNFVATAATSTLSVAQADPPNSPIAPPPGTVLYSYSITQPDGSTTGYAPNGNISAYTDLVNGKWTAGYDNLNRLISASVVPTVTTGQNAPTAQSFCWNYDSFGNRTLQARAPGSLTSANCEKGAVADENYVSASYSAANQLSSLAGEVVQPGGTGNWTLPTPDASGNTKADVVNQYFYDGDNRLCAVVPFYGAAEGYLYNADGMRVAKGLIRVPDNSFDPCDMSANGFTMTTEYIPGPSGEQMTEIDWTSGQAKWVHTNAAAEGMLIATYTTDHQGGSNLHFHLTDWLGTRRLQTDALGNPEEACSGGSFGDELSCSFVGSAQEATEQHFTGKERDTESGLDYFGARYYGAGVGRFISPDDGSDQNPDNPQSWNLYSYGRNSPLVGVDQDGHVYSVCAANLKSPQDCGQVDDQTFDKESQRDGKYGEYYQNGQIFHLGADGNQVLDGTYKQTDVDTPGDFTNNLAGANMIGNGGMGMVNGFIKNMAYTAIGDGLVGVAGSTFEASSLATQYGRNFLKGNVGESVAGAVLRMKGYRIVGQQVSVMTSAGRRVVDYVVEKEGELIAIEVKTGRGRSAAQLAKDAAMETQGGRVGPSGGALAGQTLKVRTIEMKPW